MSPRPVAPGGVRRKLLVLSSLIVATASLLMLLYFPRRWQRSILESAAHQAGALAEMAAWNVAIPLLFEDPVGAVESLGGARHAGGVLYLVACDQEGQVFAAHALEAAERLDYRRPSTVAAGLDDAYRVSAPILHEEREIGRLYLGLSLEAARAEIARLRLASALFGGVVLVLAIAAAAWMSAAVTRPLRDMVQATEEIRRGDWTRRAAATAKGEIGDLARAFNAMMDHLLQARVELAELNDDLEGRVVQRTVELEAEVAERRAREEELRLANERFALAAAAISGAIYDWDVDSDTIRWSDGIQRAFGYPEREAQQPVHWWTERLHPEDRERVVVQLADDLQHGRDFSAEYRFRNRDGGYIPVWDRGQVVRDGEGRIVRMVGVMENVAALKELENQLRHVQKMEAVGLLAGGVAHDFNNLLTTILGYSDLLLADLPADDRHREYAQEIQNSGQRAASLTRQLLAFSRREVVQPRVLDVNTVVTNLERMLRRLIGEDVRFETRLDEGVANVRADRGQLEQLILNVAVNARDAMPQGGTLAIATRNRRLETDFVRGNLGARTGDYAVIEIVDTGCGMEESVRARVFEPFFTTKPPGKGTGLGMAIVYGIVKQSGGYVKAESAPGQGTTISVFLPAVAAASQAAGASVAAPAPQGRDRTVLLVEDEGAVRGLVASVLRAHHFQVLEAADAEAALRIEAAFAGTIDLVLTDVVMPGLSGRELVERLLEKRPRVRVLYMSGYTDDRIVRNGVHGAAQLLAKPFTPEELLRRVGASLAPQAADAAPEPLSEVA